MVASTGFSQEAHRPLRTSFLYYEQSFLFLCETKMYSLSMLVKLEFYRKAMIDFKFGTNPLSSTK